MLTIPQCTEYVRIDAASAIVGMSSRRIRTYIRAGIVRPARVEGRRMLFGATELAHLRRVRRLSDDLGLNIAGIEVVLRLQDQISTLQRELAEADTKHRSR
jgi:MerR family transcriptional regulator/heat shock protein HspR